MYYVKDEQINWAFASPGLLARRTMKYLFRRHRKIFPRYKDEIDNLLCDYSYLVIKFGENKECNLFWHSSGEITWMGDHLVPNSDLRIYYSPEEKFIRIDQIVGHSPPFITNTTDEDSFWAK